MNREIHVRFWESPDVKVLRATRHMGLPGDAGKKRAALALVGRCR